MKLLAIETTTDACSVAVSDGDRWSAERHVEARAHTRVLVPMIRRQLVESRLSIDRLDAIVLGNGPGSFIGLRIGASVAQGIAFAAGLPIVPVSSLAAIAAEAFAAGADANLLVAQDARMGEIYVARFRPGQDAQPLQLGETELISTDAFDASGSCSVAGGAWRKHKAMVADLPASTRVLDIELPDARFLLQCARQELLAGRAVDPADLEPGYVRQKVAAVPGQRP